MQFKSTQQFFLPVYLFVFFFFFFFGSGVLKKKKKKKRYCSGCASYRAQLIHKYLASRVVRCLMGYQDVSWTQPAACPLGFEHFGVIHKCGFVLSCFPSEKKKKKKKKKPSFSLSRSFGSCRVDLFFCTLPS